MINLRTLLVAATTMVLFALLPNQVHAAAVGLSNGEFRVDESGAANYSIEIVTPNGRAGVKPVLGLSYSSGNPRDSVVGVGWSLTGLSAVVRCARDQVRDGELVPVSLTSSDRFCLDGQRLELISGAYGAPGSAYRKENDDQSTITAVGGSASDGPQYFKVETKSGDTHLYGNPAGYSGLYVNSSDPYDAFVEPNGTSQGVKARIWALKATEDVKSNYILYEYEKDINEGVHRIKTIKYTGQRTSSSAPFAEISFEYASYFKGFSGFQAGHVVRTNKRVSRIDSFIDGEAFRSFHLEFEASDVAEERLLLTSVQECASSVASAATCYPATTFEWQRPALTHPMGSYQPFNQSSTIFSGVDGAYTSQVFDMTGDGISDLIYSQNSYWILKSSEFGTTYLTQYAAGDPEKALNIDYDGDGRRELLVATSDSSPWNVIEFKESSGVTPCPIIIPCPTTTVSPYYNKFSIGRTAKGLGGTAMVADFNGDGLEDIIFKDGSALKGYKNLGSGNFTTEITLFSGMGGALEGLHDQNPKFKNAAGVDFNGDGKSDIASKFTTTSGACYVNGQLRRFVNNEWECVHEFGGTWQQTTTNSLKVLVAGGTESNPSYSVFATFNGQYDRISPADFNGDGLIDLAYLKDNYWRVRLSTGTGFTAESTIEVGTQNYSHLTRFVDVNGDGRADMLHAASSSSWYVMISTASSDPTWPLFINRGTYSFPANSAIQFGDMNGDGKLSALTSTGSSWIEHRRDPGEKEYAISHITNGHGVKTSIEYETLRDVLVFRDSSELSLPDSFSPLVGMQVVSKVLTDSNKIGSTTHRIAVSYEYGGLLIHKNGFGSLGFEMVRSTDLQTGVISETGYKQSIDPGTHLLTGLPLYTTSWLDGQMLSNATNTLALRTSAQGGKFPYVQSSTETAYVYGSDGYSDQVSQTVTTNQYDSWGNLVDMTVQITESGTGDQLTTHTANDFGTGAQTRYGRLQESEVTKSRTGASTLIRKTAYTYRSSDMLLESTIVSPDSDATKLTTTYGYDGFGNKTSVAVAGWSTSTGSPVTRTTTTVYGSRGRYVDYVANALGEQVNYQYNGTSASAVTGRVTSRTTTDPNGLATTEYFDDLGVVESTTYSDSKVSGIARSYCDGGCPAEMPTAYYKIATSMSGSPDKEVFHDAWGRPVGQRIVGFDGGWDLIRTTYDAEGREYQRFEPNSATYFTEFQYDEMRRLSETTQPTGATVLQTFDGLLTTTKNEIDQYSYRYDNAFGETKSTEDAIGNAVEFTYDVFGNTVETKVTTAGGTHVLQTPHDLWGRKKSTTDPVKGKWTYKYNAFGELHMQTTARGHTTKHTYDLLGRVKRAYESSEGTRCWNYGSTAHVSLDAVGQLLSVEKFAGTNATCGTGSPTYKETYTYNSQSLVESITTTFGGSSYVETQQYDSFSRPTITQFPTGTAFAVENVYNGYGYLRIVRNAASQAILKEVIATDSRGNITQEEYGNGVVSNRLFEPATGRLSSVDVVDGGLSMHYVQAGYDDLGNVQYRESYYASSPGTGTHFTETYSYDALNRLDTRSIDIQANGSPPLSA